MGFYDSGFPILSVITYLPLAGALLMLFINKENTGAIKTFATIVAAVDFVLSVPLWFYFDRKAAGLAMFQFRETAS